MKLKPARAGSQRELAEKLKVTPAMVSRWKHGKVGLSVKMARHWSKVLNVDPLTLLTANSRDRPKLLGLKKKR